MKKLLGILVIFLFWCNSSLSDIIEVNQLTNDKQTYEKMEMLFDDYRIYTHRQGGIKIKRISDNKQLVVFSDKFKIKFYNDGEALFDFILDEKKEIILVKFKGVELFSWESTYVPKHQAYFFQIRTTNNDPFHYYIKLQGGKPSIALNMEKFNVKIDKAVSKAKIRLASKHNITLEQIELILKRRKEAINKKLEKVVGEEKDILEEATKESVDEALSKSIDETLQASLNQELAAQLEETIGQEIAKEFDAIIIEGMEAEFASLVDEAVAEAVSEGISEATAEAAIRAVMDVFAAGGTEEEAMAACQAIAGDAC